MIVACLVNGLAPVIFLCAAEAGGRNLAPVPDTI
jgi:hypothetical protein